MSGSFENMYNEVREKMVPLNNFCVSPDHLIIKQANSGESPSVSERNIEEALWHNRHVKSIVFDEFSLKSIRFLSIEGLCMDCLTHLMITLRGFRMDEKNTLMQLARIKMPLLYKVRLDSVLSCGEQECAMLYANLFEFLSYHASKIKSLVFRHSFRPYTDQKTTESQRFNLNLPWDADKTTTILEHLTALNVEDLTIFLDRFEGHGQFNLGLHVLSNQTDLSRLEVQICSAENAHLIYHCVEKVIQQNEATLEHFCLTRKNITAPIEDLEHILKALNLCPNLESLRLFVFTMQSFPHKLPPTLKLLDITGALHPDILKEIQMNLPRLEEMQFFNLTEDFVNLEGELIKNLKGLVLGGLPQLRMIRWYNPRFHLDFLCGKPGLSVKTSPNNVYASIIYINN